MCRRAPLSPLVDGLGSVLWAAAALVLQTGWLQAAGPAGAYDDAVAPLLTRFCNECHAGDTPEAGVRLDDRHPDLAKTIDRGLWLKVLRQIEGGVMPPEGCAMPTEEEMPCPKGPVVISTPAVWPYSGWPGVSEFH